MENEILSNAFSNIICTFLRTRSSDSEFNGPKEDIISAPFYGQDHQINILRFLNQNPSDIPFIRMGQIALYVKKCKIPGVVFGHIYGQNIGYNNTSNDSDTNVLSDRKHKTRYWMFPFTNLYPFYCADIFIFLA